MPRPLAAGLGICIALVLVILCVLMLGALVLMRRILGQTGVEEKAE